MVRQMLIDRELCVIRENGCEWFASTLHHVELRSQGGKNSDTVPVCAICHSWAHNNVKEATERGFIKRGNHDG